MRFIHSQLPVLNQVRDIMLGGENGDYALISYENMARLPYLACLDCIKWR